MRTCTIRGVIARSRPQLAGPALCRDCRAKTTSAHLSAVLRAARERQAKGRGPLCVGLRAGVLAVAVASLTAATARHPAAWAILGSVLADNVTISSCGTNARLRMIASLRFPGSATAERPPWLPGAHSRLRPGRAPVPPIPCPSLDLPA